MKVKRAEFTTYLDTRGITDEVSELLADFVTLVHNDSQTIKITVKTGFITDFASVPKIPFAYLLFGGIGNYPAVTHDGLYSISSKVEVVDIDTGAKFEVTRQWADEVFKAGLIERGISSFKVTMMYWAVRLKGGSYYKKS
jgi:hypothetical protein